VPIARNALVFDAGLDIKLKPAATLGVSYSGQFGSGVTDQGMKANLAVKF
jgi:outer membrane autotransporter protein